MRAWLPGLDVIVAGSGALGLLNRSVFSAALQDVRPVTLHLVCAGLQPAALDAVRANLAPILALAGDVELVACAGMPDGARRYRAALGVGEVIYPEGWRLLIAALEAGGAAMATGAVVQADVRWLGAVPYVAGKRRRELAGAQRRDGLAHGSVLDRARPEGGGCCRIEVVVGEAWEALR